MSSKAVELVQRAERGERVKKVREALGMTGEEFAEELTELSQSFGVRAKYDRSKVSRMEGGGRRITVEEVAIVAMLDPEERSIGWLVFGDIAKKATTKRFQRLLAGKRGSLSDERTATK